MKTYPWILKVRIEGHTDDRGRKARNRRLSQRRAAAVRRFLVKQGVKASRLVAKGYGEAKPIQASCRKLRDKSARKACWAQNRRVAFKILKTDKVAAPNTTIKSR